VGVETVQVHFGLRDDEHT